MQYSYVHTRYNPTPQDTKRTQKESKKKRNNNTSFNKFNDCHHIVFIVFCCFFYHCPYVTFLCCFTTWENYILNVYPFMLSLVFLLVVALYIVYRIT